MSDDPARARHGIISAVRLAGVVLVLLGVLESRGFLGLPGGAAYVMVGVGLLGVFLAPLILARRWRTPE